MNTKQAKRKKLVNVLKGNGLKKGSLVTYEGEHAKVAKVINGTLIVIHFYNKEHLSLVKNDTDTRHFSEKLGWVSIPE